MACDIKRILTFNNAVNYKNLIVYNSNHQNVTAICKYSWSTDKVCWVNWVDYKTFQRITPNLESDFYLRILLFGGFDRVETDGAINNCHSICLAEENPFLNDFCENENLFQPYNNMECALQLQKQLADSIVCMFGIPIYYIKTNPNVNTADYTFKEYVLHDVVDIKQIKLMVQDGTMPSSKPMFTDFDFEWDSDWEVELSKSQFAKAFGDTAVPHVNDFIYIPMMRRLWDVNSAYDEKSEGLMWRSTTWKLALAKYTDSWNVETHEFDDVIEGWVKSRYENSFGREERKEMERETGVTQIQAPKFAATNLTNIFIQDAMRKQVTKEDIIVKEQQFNNKAIVVGKGLYKFKNQNGCIIYQNQFCGDSGSVSLIIETPGIAQEGEYSLFDFGEIELKLKYSKKKFTLNFNGLEQDIDGFNTYLINLQWSRQNYITNMTIYKYVHNEEIPVYQLRPNMYYFDFENPICNLTKEYNNDWATDEKKTIQLHGYPLSITNFKVYTEMLGDEMIKESLKYITTNKNCIVSDLARLIDDGHGYIVK